MNAVWNTVRATTPALNLVKAPGSSISRKSGNPKYTQKISTSSGMPRMTLM
jgi:hypothetical protein